MAGIEDDFEHEFSSIKEMSKEMLESDNLVKRIREKKGLHQTTTSKQEQVDNQEVISQKPHEIKRGVFLKSFKSLRKNTKAKDASVKIRTIKVTNSNAPESSPIKSPNSEDSLPTESSGPDSSPQKILSQDSGRRIMPDNGELNLDLLNFQSVNESDDFHEAAIQTQKPISKYMSTNPSNAESIFNPLRQTQSKTTQPSQESFLDKLKKAAKSKLGGSLVPPSLKRQIKNLSDEDRIDQNSKKQKTTDDEQKDQPVSLDSTQEIKLPKDQPVSLDPMKEIKVSKEEVAKMKSIITHQLVGNFNNLLNSSLHDKYMDLYNMFEHTIHDNEGHSVLLIGPRSSGKSAMINMALNKLEKDYPQKFITIRLNAFIHIDDNVALREIAKQLDIKLGGEADDQMTFELRSINDTFANILATLDKNEVTGDDEHRLSIIFIIDEFDKFTSDTKQTLLYNLFDLCQTSSVPICIVGVSTKITVRESLEKRVRSRFSQRLIIINKPSTLDEFWSDAKLSLMLNEKNIEHLGNEGYGKAWNNYIENLFTIKTSNFFKILFQNYYTLKNFQDFNNNFVYPVSQISLSSPFIDDAKVALYQKCQSKNHIQSIVSSLSQLELFLAIAATRWIEKYELQTLNFNLAYNEYVEMIKTFNIIATTNNSDNAFDNNILTNFKINQKIWSSEVMKNLWEILYKLGLLLDSPTNEGGHIINTNQPKSLVIDDNRMVQVDISLDELATLIPDSNIFKRLTRL